MIFNIFIPSLVFAMSALAADVETCQKSVGLLTVDSSLGVTACDGADGYPCCVFDGELRVLGSNAYTTDAKYFTMSRYHDIGIQIAIDEVNRNCGIKHTPVGGVEGNYKLKHVVANDHSSQPISEAVAATHLGVTIGTDVNGDKTYTAHTDPNFNSDVAFYTAPYSSSLCLFVNKVVSTSGVASMAPGCSAGSVYNGIPNVFGVRTPASAAMTSAVQLYQSMGATTVATVAEDTTFTLAVCSGVQPEAESLGMTFDSATVLNENAADEDILNMVLSWKESKPDLIVGCTYEAMCTRILQAMKDNGLDPNAIAFSECVGVDTVNDALGHSLTGFSGSSQFSVVTAASTNWDPNNVYNADNQAFFGAFRDLVGAKSGSYVPFQSATAYTSVHIMIDAINNNAGSLAGSDISDYLLNNTIPTPFGDFSFSENGQASTKAAVIQYDENLQLQVVYPPAVATGSAIYPRPTFAKLDCMSSRENGLECGGYGSCQEDGSCLCLSAYEEAQQYRCSLIRVDANDQNRNIAAIIGGSAAGVVALILIVAGVGALLYRRRLRRVGVGNSKIMDHCEEEQVKLSDDQVATLAPRRSKIIVATLPGYSDSVNLHAIEIFKGRVNEHWDDVLNLRAISHINLRPFIGLYDNPKLTMNSQSFGTIYLHEERGTILNAMQSAKFNLDVDFRNELVRQLAAAFAHLQKKGVRPMGYFSPLSVFVDRKWNLKVSDYGLVNVYSVEALRLIKDAASYYVSPELTNAHIDRIGGGPAWNPTIRTEHFSFAHVAYLILEGCELHTTLKISKSELLTQYQQGIPMEAIIPNSCSVDSPLWPIVRKYMMADCADRSFSFEKTYTLVEKMCGAEVDLIDKLADGLHKNVASLDAALREELARSRKLLTNLFPTHVSKALVNHEDPRTEQYESCTVGFIAVADFATIGSEYKPQEMVTFLNELYSRFDDIIDNYDVYKVETIGSTYMISSGVPVRNGSRHAAEIAACLIKLLSAAQKIKVGQGERRMGVHVKAGAHTGPVAATVLGTKMPRYVLVGDTVNMASRMMTTSDIDKVQISPDTNAFLKAGCYEFEADSGGLRQIKGKGEIETFFIQSVDME